jgi:hypothetical protein
VRVTQRLECQLWGGKPNLQAGSRKFDPCHAMEKLPQEEYYRRIEAVKKWMYAKENQERLKGAGPMQIRWLLACAGSGEKHPDIIGYGKGII